MVEKQLQICAENLLKTFEWQMQSFRKYLKHRVASRHVMLHMYKYNYLTMHYYINGVPSITPTRCAHTQEIIE